MIEENLFIFSPQCSIVLSSLRILNKIFFNRLFTVEYPLPDYKSIPPSNMDKPNNVRYEFMLKTKTLINIKINELNNLGGGQKRNVVLNLGFHLSKFMEEITRLKITQKDFRTIPEGSYKQSVRYNS